jgi:hypothetical protein
MGKDFLDDMQHVATSQMERFCLSALPEVELAVIAEHLTVCESCHDVLAETLRNQRGSEPLSIDLDPESWLVHEHVDFEQLTGIADNTLDETDIEIIDIHLKMCATCREDVRSFLAFHKELEPQLLVRYGPRTPKPPQREAELSSWHRRLAWKPAYAAAAIILVGIALAIAVLVLKHRMNGLETSIIPTPQTSPAPTPNGERARTPPSPLSSHPGTESASNGPTPTTAPSPKGTVNNSSVPINSPDTVVALKDGRSEVTLDKSGNVNGIDDAISETRRDVADALRTERIEQASVLTDLTAENSSLRGNGASGAPFRLLSPARAVIIESRPVFKWEELTGASSYRVYVLDSKGHILAKSEVPSTIREWRISAPIGRDKIYSWVVVAIVEGKEVVSPGPAAPEVKFQVLSASNLQKIVQLKRTRSHLALGVLYAKVGLLDEAEHEFQELVRLNPDVQVAKQLLRSVQSIRRTSP